MRDELHPYSPHRDLPARLLAVFRRDVSREERERIIRELDHASHHGGPVFLGPDVELYQWRGERWIPLSSPKETVSP